MPYTGHPIERPWHSLENSQRAGNERGAYQAAPTQRTDCQKLPPDYERSPALGELSTVEPKVGTLDRTGAAAIRAGTVMKSKTRLIPG